jgi:hypothetical protein
MMFPWVGKRLTTEEKGRMLAYNLAIYGLPTVASLYPVPLLGEYVKKTAIENGYVVGDNFLTSLIGQGAISSMIAMLTGQHYNVGARYGTKGLEWLDILAKEDASLWNLFGGASYQTLLNTATESDGFWKAMISGAKTVMGIQHPDEVYPMTIDVLLRPLREISSVNTAWRLMETANTANWYSKQGRVLENEVSLGEALFMSVTGLQRQSTEDIFTYAQLRKSTKSHMDDIRRRFFINMSQYYRDAANNDFDQAKEHFQQGQANLINYPVDKIFEVYAEAARANRPLAQSIPWAYYHKDQFKNKAEDLNKAGQSWQNVRENK